MPELLEFLKSPEGLNLVISVKDLTSVLKDFNVNLQDILDILQNSDAVEISINIKKVPS